MRKILAESVAFTPVWRVGVSPRDLDPRGREIRRLYLLPRKPPREEANMKRTPEAGGMEDRGERQVLQGSKCKLK